MKVLVMGATGGSGRAAVERLLAEGHDVTAFGRSAEARFEPTGRLTPRNGDAMDADEVLRAVRGHDAVVVTLGISENPLRVRLFGAARTPNDVRSKGTAHVIRAMREAGLRRLVVQTSFGVGATRDRLRLADRLFFSLLLKPQIADTEVQNAAVEKSGLDWVLVQPVHLTDGPDAGMPLCATDGASGRMSVSRRSVGRALALAVSEPSFVGRTVAVFGAGGTPREAAR